MHSDLPNGWRRLNKGVNAVAWLFTMGIAGGSTFFPPTTVLEYQPAWISIAWSILTGIGGLVALVASVRGGHWLELTGALIVGAGVSAYALTVWLIVLAGSPTRLTQAFALSALIVFVAGQAVRCATHAYRMRRAYENPPEV